MDTEVDPDRAHLQANPTRVEKREPRLREDVRLSQAPLAVGELQQQIDVKVGNHLGDCVSRHARGGARRSNPLDNGEPRVFRLHALRTNRSPLMLTLSTPTPNQFPFLGMEW